MTAARFRRALVVATFLLAAGLGARRRATILTVMDKMQGAFEKLTKDDKRMNAAEVTTIQQAYNAIQLGLVKNEFYIQQAQTPEVKQALTGLRDDFLQPNLEKPRRMLEKAGIPFLDLNAEERVRNLGQAPSRVLRDEEVLLDTVLSMQATIAGLQAGALTAVRGDVRDWFLGARDAAVEQWRKVGAAAYRTVPQAIPPTLSGVQ